MFSRICALTRNYTTMPFKKLFTTHIFSYPLFKIGKNDKLLALRRLIRSEFVLRLLAKKKPAKVTWVVHPAETIVAAHTVVDVSFTPSF